MMPRLAAEESLARVEATALGTGALDRFTARRLASELRQRARGGGGPTGGRSGRPDPAALAAIGIGVTVVDRKAAGD